MYIVIETFDPYWPSICMNEDGEPLIFHLIQDAQAEAAGCQQGIVVEI